MERLSFDDAQILRLESPSIQGHTCKLVLIEPGAGGPTLEIARLRERIAGRLHLAPRLRQRVVFTPLRLAEPAWVDDAEFDLARHVVAWPQDAARQPLTRARLRGIAGELMATRLDHSRPLWQMHVVGPLEDGGWAIVTRIHHCMADGISAMRILADVLWDAPAGPPAAPQAWRPRPAPGPLGLATAALRERAADLPAAAARGARSLLRPGRWAAGVRAAAASLPALARELDPRASRSPLDRHLGRRRELALAGAPLERFRAIGHGASQRLDEHVTVNDVLLAGVAGGLRSWLLERDGPELPSLRVQCPVSLHHRDERPDELGNRDSFLNVDLPLTEPDALARLARINAETLSRKRAGDPEALYAFFHALARVHPLYRAGMRLASGPHEFSLAVSNVPGPSQPLELLGAPVRELFSFAEPADRHALRISALSSAGTVHIGFCADPEAITGLARLADAVEAALEELGELASPA